MSEVSTGMPRPKSDNDQQIAIRVPKPWLERAQALVPHITQPGITVTRTDVIRVALLRGIEALEADHAAKQPTPRDVAVAQRVANRRK